MHTYPINTHNMASYFEPTIVNRLDNFRELIFPSMVMLSQLIQHDTNYEADTYDEPKSNLSTSEETIFAYKTNKHFNWLWNKVI